MDERYEREREQRIRERAYRLWEQEGRPEGREAIHWDQATELVAIEDNQRLAREPVVPSTGMGPTGEPIEPIEAVENMGEFPTMTDQGEEQTYPTPRASGSAGKGGTGAGKRGASGRKAPAATKRAGVLANGHAAGTKVARSSAARPAR